MDVPRARSTRNILRLVQELHLRGYQRLRIAPGMSASGLHWRCAITPVGNISRTNGARLVRPQGHVADYSSSDQRAYFGWDDAADADPNRLAAMFVARFPELVAEGRGSDWLYAGWYVEMLHLTYPDALPIAYADWELPSDALATIVRAVRIPLPPPGEASR